ncbi:hypothetical protein [Methylocapsa acidiphila]|uniref:hypothetical protein n=1 Tax=Methylocapsa acidiphila TaxID=133552 RepID=UPI0003F70C91|nr:hypothetical protein [Methylocapsa acidiphila]
MEKKAPRQADKKHVPEKLIDLFDKNLPQVFDFSESTVDRRTPSDPESLQGLSVSLDDESPL